MTHYRTEKLPFSKVDFCLITKGPFSPWTGSIVVPPSHVHPGDVPTPLLDAYAEQFALQPEAALNQFLEANPNLNNPRDIGRILFHTDGLSPYALSVLFFNSNYSSRALLFSFMTAIDLDILSLPEAMAYITQKVAIPTKSLAMCQYANSFASAYSLRNQLEWPDWQVVQDLILTSLCFCVLGGEFSHHVKRFESLKTVAPEILKQVEWELQHQPPALYFSSVPTRIDGNQELTGELDHEGRFRSSWNTYRYVLKVDEIICKELKGQKTQSIIPLQAVTAKQKTGTGKKPWCMVLQKIDGAEFGDKVAKDGSRKPSSRTSYTLACKTEEELMTWIAGVNQAGLLLAVDGLTDGKSWP
jgi:hypothetical protein